jgi:hypothetical protein
VTTLNGSLKFPVCFLRGVSGTVEGNNGPDMVRETIKRVDKCNHIFGLVSVVLPGVNAGSSHILRRVQVFFIPAVNYFTPRCMGG